MKSISKTIKGFFYGAKTKKKTIDYKINKINTLYFNEFDTFFLNALKKGNFEHAQEMLDKGYQVNKEIKISIENEIYVLFVSEHEKYDRRDRYLSEYFFHPEFKDYFNIIYLDKDEVINSKNLTLNLSEKTQKMCFFEFVEKNNLIGKRGLIMFMENPRKLVKIKESSYYEMEKKDSKMLKEFEDKTSWQIALGALSDRMSTSQLKRAKNGSIVNESYLSSGSLLLGLSDFSHIVNIKINNKLFGLDLDISNKSEIKESDIWENPYLIQYVLYPQIVALLKGPEYEDRFENYWSENLKNVNPAQLVKINKDSLYMRKIKLLISMVKNNINNGEYTPKELFEISLDPQKIEFMHQWAIFIWLMYPEEIFPLLNKESIKMMLSSKEMSAHHSENIIYRLLKEAMDNENEVDRKSLMKRLEKQVNKTKSIQKNTIEDLMSEYNLSEEIVIKIKKIEATVKDLSNKTLRNEENLYIKSVNGEIWKMIESVQSLKELDENLNHDETLGQALSVVLTKLQDIQRVVLTEQLNELNRQGISAQVVAK